MKQTSTNSGIAFKKYLVLLLTVLGLTIGQFVYAHTVDSYSGSCITGPQYKVTAVVSNVNSSSNYRWQWKNSSNAWVCFVNGANVINGTSYNVTGSVYNLTTTPGPIVFTNADAGLQGLEIRMVISDGNGVNPCNLPAGNTWTSTTNHFINVSNTPCAPCTGKVTSLYFNELNGGADLPITNGATFTINQLGSLYNLEAGTSGAVGSVKYTITGPTASSNIENTTPYNSPATGGGAWTGAAGTYTVNLKTYSASGATGTLCHDTTITFTVTTFDCNCTGTNMVLNPGFESGTTNWTWSGGTLAQGTGAVACGSFSGDLNNTSASSKAWQVIGTDLPIGTGINVSVYAGTHDNTFNNWVAVEFLNASNVILGTSVYVQVDKILANSPAGPQLYTFSVTVPTGTKYTRVAFGGTGSYTKTDRWCVNSTAPLGSIGDRVWLDANGNGIQDATETGGITGVTVQIRNSSNTVIATQNTNGTGNYLFTGLAAGTYTVVFPVSISGSVVTTANVGSDDNIDSDPSQTTGITPVITLASGQSITNVDAGYCPVNLQLGNRVWYDTNNNGINDAAENGIRNVTVNLYKDDNNDNVADGAALATVLTDVNGNYLFSNLAPGNYIVGAVTPKGYMSSAVNGGDPDNNTDLDDNGQVAAGAEMRGLAITITGGGEPSGNTNNTYDFGFLPDCNCTTSPNNLLVNGNFESGTTGWSWSGGSLTTGTGYIACGAANGFNNWSTGTSKVWQDVNMTAGSTVSFSAFAGTHTPGIACSPTLSLIFLNASNVVLAQSNATVTRDVDINNSQLEQYSITAVAPAGTAKVRVQSSITCNTMKMDAFCLTAVTPGSIGDRVWNDVNKNGIQDAGEVGIAGVVVTLYDGATNTVLASTVTDAYGNYLFSNLATSVAGINYQVRFSLVPGYTFSPNTGAVTVTDNSDANVNTGRTGTITLTTAVPNITYADAGMYFTQAARIGDFVWNDLNKNGLQDAGEPGIAGVTVMLYTSANVLYRSTITSNNGYYAFNDVPAGSYYVKVAPPIGYQVSPKDAGADNADSDIDPVTFNTGSITVVNGTVNLTIDAGLNATTQAFASLGDRVWEDLNNNNLQDSGEPGIANVTVQLFNAANVLIATTTTDAFGNYIFNGLTPGNYYVKVGLPAGFSYVSANAGTDDNIDSDVDATGTSQVVTLIADQVNTTVDAGLRRTTAGAAIGDFVWYDLNKNGVQDGGSEIGVPGVTVVLYTTANTVAATTTTDASGFYLFTGLPASTNYTVGFENIPAGYNFSPNAGAVSVTNNSDVIPTTGRTGTVTTGAAGTTVTYVDAGIISTPNTFDSKGSIGDKVWNDLNNNGIQDAGEPGVAGVTVTLYGADGTTVIATTTTDALGNYLFTNLDAASYVVGFSGLPAGYVFATQNAGSDDNKDSDADATTGKTAPFSLAAGEINLSVDAGARNSNTALSTLGNYVWYDVNANGIQDAAEMGAAGVSVALKNASGAVIKTTTTDINGLYLFTDLAAGTYTIQFGNLPAGFVATAKNAAGSTAANNSDADATTLATDNIVLPASATDLTWDFGIKSTTRGSIGDFVWNDLNGDGIQQAGEPGVAGVTVILYDNNNNPVASTITDANGMYLFSNVLPGTYSVGFSNIPSSSAFTTQNAAGGTAATNSDPDPATGRTAPFTLAAGQSKTDVDAGLVSLKASVGNYVWNDLNSNGIQDANEPGIPGVTVILYNSSNVAVGSAVTNANGYYLINNIPVPSAGASYTIGFTDIPVNFIFTTKNAAGSTADNNSDANTATGVTDVFTLTPGQVRLDIDAGLKNQVGSIGDRVWNDTDGDGIQDPGEVGVAGVTVVLLNAAGQPIATTTTDAFGNYKFSGLLPGNYAVRITPPANYTLSPKTQGGDTNLDSDFDPITYTTGTVSLAAGQNRTDIDAGLKFTQPSTASVGDRVWYDANANGNQDAGEAGVSNVLVTLYNSSNVAVRSTYTDVNGNYLFTDVAPGTYTVGVSLPPAFVFTTNSGAVSGTTNSDIVPATGRTASFTVNAGDQITYVDAGIKTQTSGNGSVGDYVWNDINKNGFQEPGEPGIPGVLVRLFNTTTNALVGTTTTDITGKYIFNDLPPANYQVDFVTPAGYTITTKLNSNVTASGDDSDVDPANSRTAIFALSAGQRITTVDAGYWLTNPPGTGAIGDRVWLDANQNGVQDAGEASVQGITVTLYDAASTAIKMAVTDANGNYLFTDLAAGNYSVGFSNLPAGYTFTTQGLGTAASGSDANPATGRTATIALAAGQTNLDVDAGIRSQMAGTASIGNRVWADLNNNGLQDAGEPGIQGVTVELLDAAGNPVDKDPDTPGVQPTTTITNALGEYLFTGLGAGDYRVRFSTLPAGYNASPKAAGTNRDIDSDGNPIAAGASTTDVLSVAAGEERLDIDFGLFNPTAPLGQIGDFVWFDSNNNGVQDPGEQGVPGVTVTLLNTSNVVVATTVTDANGNYRFVNVADGSYTVKFSNLPAGFAFSPKDLGGNDNADSDADPITGATGNYTISGGNTILTVDAGIYSTRAALGDYVWFDANSNGTQDATEKGIAGITVTLYDANNVAVTSAITDQNGRYFFSNLNPGTYTVGFGTTPGKLVFTTKDVVAAGDAADSDVDPATGKTGSYTLAAGQVNLTVDAGLKPLIPATVGDFVWYDLNRDGLQDPGEPGVPGVLVTLYNAANQPVGSAVTDGNGYYLISNVPAGNGYYTVFSNTPDPAAPFTLQNVGGAAATDNSKADATGKSTPFNVAEGQNVTNIDAGIYRLINIHGNVWNDANGLTDLQINRTGVQAIPNSLNIYLVDVATNQIVQAESINNDGTYNFFNVDINHSYVIVLSTIVAFPGQASPAPFLPSGWQRVGENLGAGPLSGSDGVPNGLLFIDTETSDVFDANFGIRVSSGEVIIG